MPSPGASFNSLLGRLWIFLRLAGVLVPGALLMWNRTQTPSALIDCRIQAFSEFRAGNNAPRPYELPSNGSSQSPAAGAPQLDFVHDAPVNVEALIQVELHGFEQSFGFQLLPRGNDFLQRHAGSDRETVLRDDWPLVQVHRYEMR